MFLQFKISSQGTYAILSTHRTIQVLIVISFVHQYDEEYSEAKKLRRPGRPASVREDLLRMKIEALETEYKNGFRKSQLKEKHD